MRNGASGFHRELCVWVKDGVLCKAWFDDRSPMFNDEDELERYLKDNYKSFEGKSVHDGDFLWIGCNTNRENEACVFAVEY